jgi:hypothetical protein
MGPSQITASGLVEAQKLALATLQDLGECIFAARRDSAPWEIDALRDSLIETLNEYPTSAL